MSASDSPAYTVNTPPGSPPPIMLPPFQGPASPRSVGAILQAHPDVPNDLLRDMVASLVQVTAQRERTYQTELDTYQDKLKVLHIQNTDLSAKLNEFNDDTANCPDGFEENNGRLTNFYIPSEDGLSTQAHFVKRNDAVPY